ncbi:MAG: hypothetical protein K1X94_36820 [Sandaracinaceae bacterium]|nr:hypothetical protein [Sandaracinaceae bacterium]
MTRWLRFGLGLGAVALAACNPEAPSDVDAGTHHASDDAYVPPGTDAYVPPGTDAGMVHTGGAQLVAAGLNDVCAVDSRGDLYCWGDNGKGQLGRGYVEDDTPSPNPDCSAISRYPARVQGITNPLEVALAANANDFTTGTICALLSDHTVSCWGDNSNHLLGAEGYTLPDGGLGALGPGSPTPVAVPGLTNVRDLEASMNGAFACAIQANDDGTDSVLCWGANEAMQAGQAEGSGGTSDVFPPAVVSGLDHVHVRALRVSTEQACVVYGDGTVGCWGHLGSHDPITDTYTGQVGIDASTLTEHLCSVPDEFCSPSPIVVPGMTGATDVVVLNGDLCALGADGHLSCLGEGYGAGLMALVTGDQDVQQYGTPVVLPEPFSGITEVRAAGIQGLAWGCAHRADDWYCWGDNRDGWMAYAGSGPSGVQRIPDEAHAVLGLRGVVLSESSVTLPAMTDLALGQTICGIGDDGSLWCWGNSSSGEVILGGTGFSYTPYDMTNQDIGVCNALRFPG